MPPPLAPTFLPAPIEDPTWLTRQLEEAGFVGDVLDLGGEAVEPFGEQGTTAGRTLRDPTFAAWQRSEAGRWLAYVRNNEALTRLSQFGRSGAVTPPARCCFRSRWGLTRPADSYTNPQVPSPPSP